jgi:hypothetical protein
MPRIEFWMRILYNPFAVLCECTSARLYCADHGPPCRRIRVKTSAHQERFHCIALHRIGRKYSLPPMHTKPQARRLPPAEDLDVLGTSQQAHNKEAFNIEDGNVVAEHTVSGGCVSKRPRHRSLRATFCDGVKSNGSLQSGVRTL